MKYLLTQHILKSASTVQFFRVIEPTALDETGSFLSDPLDCPHRSSSTLTSVLLGQIRTEIGKPTSDWSFFVNFSLLPHECACSKSSLAACCEFVFSLLQSRSEDRYASTLYVTQHAHSRQKTRTDKILIKADPRCHIQS